MVFVPRDKEALFEVQSHAFYPLADLLKLVEAILCMAPTFSRDDLYLRGISFCIESDCLSGWVCVLYIELNYEAAVYSSSYQLHSLV